VFFFVVEEGKTVEPDHAVCYASFTEAVRDCFCNADDNLEQLAMFSILRAKRLTIVGKI